VPCLCVVFVRISFFIATDDATFLWPGLFTVRATWKVCCVPDERVTK
jgi:hypothetical protein